ncbi:MAG: hypothetical protein RR406_03685, partial [Bacilli bacterium]
MKNMEWGAVAYLTQSKYGKYGNPNYTGANKEVYINNNSNFITGCSAGVPSSDPVNGCTNTYNMENTGTGASATGTIYGVYDMSGGSLEYIMGVYNQIISNSGFSILPDVKYYDNYMNTTGLKGDATYADGTRDWYQDYQSFSSNSARSWLFRGGSNTANMNMNAGVFSFSHFSGNADPYGSTRFVAKP